MIQTTARYTRKISSSTVQEMIWRKDELRGACRQDDTRKKQKKVQLRKTGKRYILHINYLPCIML